MKVRKAWKAYKRAYETHVAAWVAWQNAEGGPEHQQASDALDRAASDVNKAAREHNMAVLRAHRAEESP